MPAKNKTALITGASSGLGLEAAKELAALGFNVIMTARGKDRLEKAGEEIAKQYPHSKITSQVLDVANFDEVRSFASTFSDPIDVLMNNAGVMGPDFSLSVDGIESQMAINHLGHFVLTKALWKQLVKADEPRVITLSSTVHRRGKLQSMSLEQLKGSDQKRYDRWQRYADTKLACLLFARELDLRTKQSGSKVISIAAHPGWAMTGLQDNFPNRFDRFAQNAKQGARSQIMATVEAHLVGGEFIGPAQELWGEPKLIKGTKQSRDLGLMKQLWELSEELTGATFEL
ncbi:SDR family NAD(P)-dependent oxidoreductase [Aquiluna sp. Uisw_065]|uniref:SDR family NAD(P)-dependent oxidoreductase n=1 Tax=Aquiluna sp. Uisw_065 TaxID=3230967 RepID=UPI0039E8F1A3